MPMQSSRNSDNCGGAGCAGQKVPGLVSHVGRLPAWLQVVVSYEYRYMNMRVYACKVSGYMDS